MLEAAEGVAKGQQPDAVAKRFSKYVNPEDLVVWAHDYERMSKADFLAKYGTPSLKPRASNRRPGSLSRTRPWLPATRSSGWRSWGGGFSSSW